MKKLIKLFALPILLSVACVSCEQDPSQEPEQTFEVLVQLEYPEGIESVEGVKMVMKNSQGTTLEAETDVLGIARFEVIAGLYTATASEQRAIDGSIYNFNGKSAEIQIAEGWDSAEIITLELVETKSSQLVIKEFYFGGCQDNTGEDDYSFDSYVTLYNNSDIELSLNNMCLGTSLGNAHAMDIFGIVDAEGVLTYEGKSWTPTWNSVYQSKGEVTIPARGEIVVAIAGGIDHTVTYTNSVDLSNANYVIYDPEVLTHAYYHPTPSDKISPDNYIGASMFGTGNAVMIGTACPSLFIYQMPEGVDADSFIADPNNLTYVGKMEVDAFKVAKIEKEWILDATEAFNAAYEAESVKRLTSDLDAGQVVVTTRQGYTMYRNVDKEATEAIEGNKEKLVYGYTLGTDGLVDSGTTDPSGIDAEASMDAGAVIVYQDTNNSSKDFHQRKISSLKR